MFLMKQHDTRIALKAILQNESGPADLTGATIRFLMSDHNQKQLLIDNTAEIQDPTTGEVWYVFDASETADYGRFKAEFEATFSDGRIETFPTHGHIAIEIIRDLG